jgi:hypothetical protein
LTPEFIPCKPSPSKAATDGSGTALMPAVDEREMV